MLRTTTECMSILGGADTIANLPYDAYTIKTMNLESNCSKSTSSTKNESYFDKVNNQQMAVIISDQ
jgi:hypothetical protein